LKYLLPAIVLATASSAMAAPPTFSARVATAKAAAATREGFIYDTAMVPAIHHAFVPCVPKGTDPGRGGEFVLVADVDASGRASNIAVRPATPFARCFARTFAALTLQAPPKRPWPVVVEMQTRR